MSDNPQAIGIVSPVLPIQGWKCPLGRILFMFGVIFFVFGCVVLCYCPGVFVAAALFAAGSICFGSLFVRLLSILLLLAAISMAQYAAAKEKEVAAKAIRIRAIGAERAAKFASTNQTIPKPTNRP